MAETGEKILNSIPTRHVLDGPRVGFLGLGWIGRNRLAAALAGSPVVASAVADSSPESLAESAELAPHAVRCRSLDELLEHDLEAVVIATPSAMHAAQSIRALERGLPVFCQKPLGRTAAETRRVVDAARAADRLLAVDFSYRHVQAVRLMRRLVHGGHIGDVFLARSVFHNAYGPGKEWFFDRSQSGGGCVIDLGIHLVDLILWMLDFPEVASVSSRLFGRGSAFSPEDAGVEDYASARLDLAGGAVAEVACSWNLSTGCDAVIELDLHGTEGSLSLRNVNGSYFDFRLEHHRGRSTELVAEPPDDWGGRGICAWANQLASRPEFDPAIDETVRVATVLDAIYKHRTR